MPRNLGVRPDAVMVDIRYRCGLVVRNVATKSRRWTLDDPRFGRAYAFDIIDWQEPERAA